MTIEKFRVLAIDDDKDILDLISYVLSPEYDMLTLHDSLDALEIIEFFQPDVLILDVMIPKVTGYQILEFVKQHPKLRNTLTIFLSAKDTSRDIKYGYKLGANLYLTKPFQPERLRKNIQMLLAQNTTGAPPRKDFSIRDVMLRMQVKVGHHTTGSVEETRGDGESTVHHSRLRRKLGQEHDEIEERKWRG